MKANQNTKSFHFIDPVFAAPLPSKVSQRASLLSQRYRAAIRALELKDREEERFEQFDQLDRFRSQLEKRLRKTKLWNYAPEQREAVKEARAYLQTILGIEPNFR